ncbi:hypothetical protein [Vibrio hippocampi]|uniref:54K polar flagellar sheath protein A n=1 Tax=Vibrio hippocampi TaxID=654686 RepID=A0ABN8DHQ0_9VIBR|nr:hypothetical protein [Vibrio hippocampi]CAH0526447.1 hypothetical protein VHP8226_01810 [Vibrio hippocampi]
MKKAVILPLVAAISGVLVGCNSSSGGSSGGSTTKFTLSFATPNYVTDSSTSCTIYKQSSDANGNEQYLTYNSASNDVASQYIVGYISDADGVRQGEYLVPSSASLSFTLESIPEDGSFTLQEFRYGNKDILATTFSKSFLEDESLRSVTFGMDKDAGTGSCIAGNNYQEVSLTDLKYTNGTSSTGNYFFVSQVDELESYNSELESTAPLAAVSGEPTVILQYNTDGDINQFGVGSWGSSSILMEQASTTTFINNYSTNTYSHLDLLLHSDGYAYTANSYDNSVTQTTMPNDTRGSETWAYSVDLDDVNGWSLQYGNALVLGDDMAIRVDELFDTTNLPLESELPTVTSNGDTVDIAVNLDVDDELGFQRIAYKTSYTEGVNSYTVTHKLYSDVDSSVTVPVLYYGSTISDSVAANLLPSTASSFNRAIYIQEDETTLIDASVFMAQFAHGDSIDTELALDIDGLLASQIEQDSNAITISEQHHIQVQRFD